MNEKDYAQPQLFALLCLAHSSVIINFFRYKFRIQREKVDVTKFVASMSGIGYLC